MDGCWGGEVNNDNNRVPMAADYVNAEGKKERKKKVITDCSVIQVVIRAQSDRSLGLKPMLAVPGSGLS